MIFLELAGVLVFSISGALTGIRLRLDVVGVLTLATATGLGGGVLRDVLIGAVPPPGLADWRYLVTPVAGGVLSWWFHPTLDRLTRPIVLLDAIGLGLFSVAGALKALDAGVGILPSAVLGVITGVGGGVLRDVLCGEVPFIFRPGELVAIPALMGAATAVALHAAHLPTLVVVVGAGSLTTLWRLLAVWRGWVTRESPATHFVLVRRLRAPRRDPD
jgi:uncharacterized membrane protein YeiH